MSLFSAITGKKQSKGGQLLERLGGAERLEDRREAIAEFKDLTSRQPVRLVFEGGIGVLLNAISRSRPERIVMTPVSAVLTACAVVIARG